MNITDTTSSLPLSILFTIVALISVLAMAWLIIKSLSKIYKGRITSGEIQIRSIFALGARQHLYIVNVRDTDYFLGVTTEKIELLDRFPSRDINNEDKPAGPANDPIKQ